MINSQWKLCKFCQKCQKDQKVKKTRRKKKKYVARSRCHLFGYYAMWHNLCRPLGSTVPKLQQKIVSKGKRYKAQWCSSNYTLDLHWLKKSMVLPWDYAYLACLIKYTTMQKIVFLQPLWTDWGQYELHNHWSCVLREFFLSVFQGEVGKGNIKGF